MRMTEASGIRERSGTTDLSDLIDGWCGHVLRFISERGKHWADHAEDVWGIDDLVGAYCLRDRIEALIGQSAKRPPHALELGDQVLRSFTSEGDFDWIRHAGQSAGTGWWWRRLPTAGPVSEQIAEWDN